MKSGSVLRGIALGLLVLCLVLVVPAARAGEDAIKLGILHSLSGTMAISESVLKDTVLMLIADQNKKGGLLGRKLEPVIVDPASDWDLFAEKPGNYSRRKGRGRVRLLDFRLPKIRSADLRAAERPSLLPGAIRG